jgi:hypothetical protein
MIIRRPADLERPSNRTRDRPSAWAISGLTAGSSSRAGLSSRIERIVEAHPVEEEQRHPARIARQREDRVGSALARTEADDQCVVVVVDELVRARQQSPHFRERRPRGRPDLRRILREEPLEVARCAHCTNSRTS